MQIVPELLCSSRQILSFHKSWQDWVNHSIAVMDTYFLKPNFIDLEHLQASSIESKQVLKFTEPLYELLFTRLAEYFGQSP